MSGSLNPHQTNIGLQLLGPFRARPVVWQCKPRSQFRPSQAGGIASQLITNRIAIVDVFHRTFPCRITDQHSPAGPAPTGSHFTRKRDGRLASSRGATDAQSTSAIRSLPSVLMLTRMRPTKIAIEAHSAGICFETDAHPHQTLERPASRTMVSGCWSALPAARSQQSRRNMGSVDPETRPKQRASRRGLHDERIADCVANVPGPVHRGAAGKPGNHSGACATGQSRRDDHAALLIRVRAGVAVSSVDPEGVDRAGGGVLIRLKTDHESPRIVTNEHE